VDFEQVPDLVEKRKVFLRNGKAYLPLSEQQSLIVAEFSANLETALEVS
jgi:DNA primase large subunit